MDTRQIAIFTLATLAAGGTLYALAYPWLTDKRAEKRQQSIHAGNTSMRQASAIRETALRRGQVADSLRELEKKQKNLRNPPLSVRIGQAGLRWTARKFYIISAVLGVALGFAVFVATFSPYAGLAGLFFGALALPRWLLKHLTKRRQARFIKEFPNAIDIIVRGIKSGLPLGDCFRIVASEAQEPVKSEFRAIIETQAVGMPIADAVERFYQRLGLPEANFFAIVIAIQAKSGGNLSEALGNLAHVLRERQKMKAKIQAMSAEAKASAGIIGSLPIIVGLMVYLISPDYISQLWTRDLGKLMLGCAAFWMTCGIVTMRKMINFDF